MIHDPSFFLVVMVIPSILSVYSPSGRSFGASATRICEYAKFEPRGALPRQNLAWRLTMFPVQHALQNNYVHNRAIYRCSLQHRRERRA